jgi:hypothetical protein
LLLSQASLHASPLDVKGPENPEVMSPTPAGSSHNGGELWSTVGFVYDNADKTVTDYVNGTASEHSSETPATDPFYSSTERTWREARGSTISQGEIVVLANQFYLPPESQPLSENTRARFRKMHRAGCGLTARASTLNRWS